MLMKVMRQRFHFPVFVVLSIVLGVGLVLPGYQSFSNRDAIAVVGSEAIKYERFASLMQSAEAAARERSGKELSELELSKLRRESLDNLIDETLALQGLKKLGLWMSEAEIQQTLLSMPMFKDEKGNYSQNRYEQYLQGQISRGNSVADTEAMIARSLRMSKAQSYWTNAARVSPLELDEGLKKLQRRAKAKLLVWDLSSIASSIKPTDDELHTYYAANRGSWQKSEQMKARHILIKTDALSGTTVAKAKIDELYKKVKAGEDFAKLATANSQDEGSAKRGGDLGYFNKGDMVPEFEAAAAKLKIGQISEPVLSKFGWHIIKLEGKKPGFEPTFENSRAKALEGFCKEKARKLAAQESSQAEAELATGKDLTSLAKGSKAVVKETGWFKYEDKSLLGGLGDTSSLATDLLFLDKGARLANVVSLEKGMLLGELTDEQAGEAVKDEAKLNARRGVVNSRLHSAKAQALYDGWLKSLRAETKIKDNFSNFYGSAK